MMIRCDAELRWWMLMWDSMPKPTSRFYGGKMTWFWWGTRAWWRPGRPVPGTLRPAIDRYADIQWTPIPELRYENRRGQVVTFSDRHSGDYR